MNPRPLFTYIHTSGNNISGSFQNGLLFSLSVFGEKIFPRIRSLRLHSIFLFFILSCFPGGGGSMADLSIIPAATRMYRASYDIICVDSKKREVWEKTLANGESMEPPTVVVSPSEYRGGCEEEGEHSVFYLFNLFPVTPPLNPEYAIANVVQKLEGDSMINITAWSESRYYSVLGRVSVFKVKGDVIRFTGGAGGKGK